MLHKRSLGAWKCASPRRARVNEEIFLIFIGFIAIVYYVCSICQVEPVLRLSPDLIRNLLCEPWCMSWWNIEMQTAIRLVVFADHKSYWIARYDQCLSVFVSQGSTNSFRPVLKIEQRKRQNDASRHHRFDPRRVHTMLYILVCDFEWKHVAVSCKISTRYAMHIRTI